MQPGVVTRKSTVNHGLHLLNWLDINDFSVRWRLIAWVAIECLITLLINTPLSQGLINWSERTIAKLLWRTFDCRHLSRLIVAFRNVFPVYRSCVLYPLLLCSSLFDTIIQSEILYHHNIRIDYFVRLISFLFPQFIASIYPLLYSNYFCCSRLIHLLACSHIRHNVEPSMHPFRHSWEVSSDSLPWNKWVVCDIEMPFVTGVGLLEVSYHSWFWVRPFFVEKWSSRQWNVEWNPDCAIRLYNL